MKKLSLLILLFCFLPGHSQTISYGSYHQLPGAASPDAC